MHFPEADIGRCAASVIHTYPRKIFDNLSRQKSLLLLRIMAGITKAKEEWSKTFYRRGNLQVHKFGGTCLATARRISDAASHIIDTYRASGDQQMVVVSAMGSHITSPVKVR